ncbi:GNAT family N-acetyltransferase [Rhodococcus sp. ABRD24]|uniref:GNAT family N-acetyltransferase n=1 Tax=Rhodococcus sp. ABRD24 TaxID=2507582 RepID=UPI0010402EAD|nr:GNAT family N-acetyltransferase [Rhodococcus sp. ABRD24]QBJ96313.1 GNAT family N-acetyltransferase [Rhodococcus sp. ABRD24]
MTLHDTISVRPATDNDWPALELLDSVAFAYHPVDADRTLTRALTRTEDVVVATDAGTPIGLALDLPMDLTVPGGTQVPVRGVTWVSVAPTHRRRGVLRALFAQIHNNIGRTGVPLAMLTASDAGIYGRFGYGPATVSTSVTIDRRFARFRDDAPDPGGVVLTDQATAVTRLPEIYERWRLITPGAQNRPQPQWDYTFADPEEHRDGKSGLHYLIHPDGYATFRYRSADDGMVAVVAELVAVTDAAHTALWRTLCGLDLTQRIEATQHPDDPLRLMLTDYRLPRTTRRSDDLWVRIMDVPAALGARTYALDGDIVLAVRDPYLDAGGTFALTVRDGHAECRRTDATAHVTLDLDALGSLYLGAHRARTLAAAHRIEAASDRDLALVDMMFAADRPAVLGYGF